MNPLHLLAVVIRDGREIEWFHSEKDAWAWVQHAYGVTPYQAAGVAGVAVARPLPERGPRPGDAVVYGADASAGLATMAGCLSVGLDVRTFRDDTSISQSGGPHYWPAKGSLVLAGLKRVQFWRWADGTPAAHNGGEYQMVVPLWRWDGRKAAGPEDAVPVS